MSKTRTWDEIVKDYKLALDAGGSYDTSHITNPNDKIYVEQRMATQKKIDDASAAANRAVAAARTAGTVSADLESNNILWEKTKKYTPVMMKQAGMDGLGVSQTAMLRMQNDHLNRINAAKRAREEKISAATGSVWDSYQSYVDSLTPEIDAAEQELWNEKLGDAKGEVDVIYGDYGLDAAARQAALDALLSGVADVKMRNSLREYSAGLEEDAKVIDKLRTLYMSGAESKGLTAEEYAEGVKEALFWDGVDKEEFFEWYQGLSGGGQLKVDDYLEHIGAESVKDTIKSTDELGEDAALYLGAKGVAYDESGYPVIDEAGDVAAIRALLDDPKFAGLAQSKRRYLEKAIEYFVGENENQLRRVIESTDPNKFDSAESAEEYLEGLKKYLNENGEPNTDLISSEFYENHIKPELDDFNDVWGAYRAEAEKLNREKYAAQMAGEKPIEDEKGRKWYVAISPEGDVENFMKENEEAVSEALGDYGNAKNPNIPDKTVIKVDGVHLVYDKTSSAWKYVLGSDQAKRDVTDRDGNRHRGVFVINGNSMALEEVGGYESDSFDRKVIEAIKALDLGNDVENGEVAEVNVNGKNLKVISYNGTWYYMNQ